MSQRCDLTIADLNPPFKKIIYIVLSLIREVKRYKIKWVEAVILRDTLPCHVGLTFVDTSSG